MKYYCIKDKLLDRHIVIQYDGFPSIMDEDILNKINESIIYKKENGNNVDLFQVTRNMKDLSCLSYKGIIHLFYFNKDNFYYLDKLIRILSSITEDNYIRIGILVDGNKEEFNCIQSQILLSLEEVWKHGKITCYSSEYNIPVVDVSYKKENFLENLYQDIINIIE